MSGLAQIMKNMGFKIQGSDMVNSKMWKDVEKLESKYLKSHKKKYKNTSILIKSSAIKNNNPEIKAAKEKKLLF